MQFPLISDRNESGLVNQSTLLQRMREYAETVASSRSHYEEEDYSEVDQALSLIDMASKKSQLGVDRKITLAMSPLFAGMRLEKNLENLRTEAHIRMPDVGRLNASSELEERRKETQKIQRAEEKLRKIFVSHEC